MPVDIFSRSSEDRAEWVSTPTWDGFKAAVSALDTAGGGTLHVPPGTYTVAAADSPYSVPATVHVVLEKGALFVGAFDTISGLTCQTNEATPTGTLTIGDKYGSKDKITSTALWTAESGILAYCPAVYITIGAERKKLLGLIDRYVGLMAQPFSTAAGAGNAYTYSTNKLTASGAVGTNLSPGDVIKLGAAAEQYLVTSDSGTSIFMATHPSAAYSAGTAIKKARKINFLGGFSAGPYAIFTDCIPVIPHCDWVRPEWFGAVADGADGGTGTDNSAAFNSAFHSAHYSNSGSKVPMPDGDWSFLSTVHILASFIGNGGRRGRAWTGITDGTPLFSNVRTSGSGTTEESSTVGGHIASSYNVENLNVNLNGGTTRACAGYVAWMATGTHRNIHVHRCTVGTVLGRINQAPFIHIATLACTCCALIGHGMNILPYMYIEANTPLTDGIIWHGYYSSNECFNVTARFLIQGGTNSGANLDIECIRGCEVSLYLEDVSTTATYKATLTRNTKFITDKCTNAITWDFRGCYEDCDFTQFRPEAGAGAKIYFPVNSASTSYHTVKLPRAYNVDNTIASDVYDYIQGSYAGVPNFVLNPYFAGTSGQKPRGWKAVTYNNCTATSQVYTKNARQGTVLRVVPAGALTDVYVGLELPAEVVSLFSDADLAPLLQVWCMPTNAAAVAEPLDAHLFYHTDGATWTKWGSDQGDKSASFCVEDMWNLLRNYQATYLSSSALTGMQIRLYANNDPSNAGNASNIVYFTGLCLTLVGADMDLLNAGGWYIHPNAGRWLEGGKTAISATTAPSSAGQYWMAGDVIKNSAPAIGGWKEVVCITAGEDGVWVPDYVLADVGSAKTADYNVEDDDIGTRFHNTGAAGTITGTLPAVADVAEGACYHFTRTASQLHRIDPDGAEVIGAGGAGKYVSLDSNGASVTLMMAAGKWNVVRTYGTTSYET